MSMTIPRIVLGRTGLTVSKLVFGTIPLGGTGWRKDPAVAPKEAGKILARAHELGVDWWDTAENYGTHPHVAEGLRLVDRSKVVISTKTPKKSYEDAKRRISQSLEELGTDYIDIYFLHFVNTMEEFKARSGALRALLEAKDEGLIRHVGLSTHRAEVARAMAGVPEIDVVLATVNKTGKNLSSPRDLMIESLSKAYESGKGIGIMKVLAYGDVTVREGLEFCKQVPHHAIPLGMRTLDELEEDVSVFGDVFGS